MTTRALPLAALAMACSGLPPAVDAQASPTADVVSVAASGSPGAYTFRVGIRSDETGCDRYADWWEVVRPDGALVHRRILGHSHVDEQPFVRGSGPVAIGADEVVWVRAHLSTGGYGATQRGSVADGFAPATPPAAFAVDLETAAPQPSACAF